MTSVYRPTALERPISTDTRPQKTCANSRCYALSRSFTGNAAREFTTNDSENRSRSNRRYTGIATKTNMKQIYKKRLYTTTVASFLFYVQNCNGEHLATIID